jgi:threonine dehydrogenase-like Zn-dependent dehydrogenase
MDHPEDAVRFGAGRIAFDPARDIIMGHEFVGEVLELGRECTGSVAAGSIVTSLPILTRSGGIQVIGQHPDAPGSFGEMFLISEALAKAVPVGVPLDAVALVDAFAVGEYYVRRSGVGTGEVPMVIGVGAIGLSAVAALASRGVAPIIAVDYNEERRELANRFGADVVVDPGKDCPHEVWRDVARAVEVISAPVIFECVGVAGMIQEIIDSCVPGSRIFAAGTWYTGDSLNCTAASQKGVQIQFGGGPQPEDWYGTLDAVCQSRLDPLPCVGKIIGLDDVPAAMAEVRGGQGPPRIIIHPHG